MGLCDFIIITSQLSFEYDGIYYTNTISNQMHPPDCLIKSLFVAVLHLPLSF